VIDHEWFAQLQTSTKLNIIGVSADQSEYNTFAITFTFLQSVDITCVFNN